VKWPCKSNTACADHGRCSGQHSWRRLGAAALVETAICPSHSSLDLSRQCEVKHWVCVHVCGPLLIDLCCGPRLHAALGVLLPVHANLTDIDAIPSETCKHPHSDFKHQHANCKGVVSTARRDEASGGMQQLTRSCIVAQYTHSALKAHCHLRLAERQHLPCTLLMQVLPLLSPERGFPVQKGCRALLLDKLGCLLAAASDGCCYLLDAESLHQDARLILHPSQTGLPVPCSCCTNNPVCNCTCQKLDGASICVL